MSKTSQRLASGVIPFIFILNFQFFHLTSQTIIPDSTVTERIEFIQDVLEEGKSKANLWWNGWFIGYSAATVGQGVVFLVSEEKSLRQDMVTGAATTLLGAVGQLITPMVPSYAPERLAKEPGGNTEERMIKLKKAEELLKASALREKTGRSWQVHAVAGVVNISSGLMTWIGFKRTVWAGVGNFVLNTVITEAQIWTQPTKAMRDFESYCIKYKPGETPFTIKSDINWYVSVYPGGLSMKVVF
jgi:hypothetical protein